MEEPVAVCLEIDCFAQAKVKGRCPKHASKQYRREQKEKALNSAPINTPKSMVITQFPYPEQITIWHCSDESEHSNEITALRWELDIVREKLNGRKIS